MQILKHCSHLAIKKNSIDQTYLKGVWSSCMPKNWYQKAKPRTGAHFFAHWTNGLRSVLTDYAPRPDRAEWWGKVGTVFIIMYPKNPTFIGDKFHTRVRMCAGHTRENWYCLLTGEIVPKIGRPDMITPRIYKRSPAQNAPVSLSTRNW